MTTTELRKTAWTLINDLGDYITIDGHIYMSDKIARQLGRVCDIVPTRVTAGGLKTVVVSR